MKDTLDKTQAAEVLELDEVSAFVHCSANTRWLWTALCRRTKQIVAFVSGDKTYVKIFPKATHRSLGKGAGETNHMERWNCTQRQRLVRFVRKTLSFSKSDLMHEVVLKGFIVDNNLLHQ